MPNCSRTTSSHSWHDVVEVESSVPHIFADSRDYLVLESSLPIPIPHAANSFSGARISLHLFRGSTTK